MKTLYNRPFFSRTCCHLRRKWCCQCPYAESPDANGTGGGSEKPPVNEDVLARLRAFEEENKALKDKLASQAAPVEAAVEQPVQKKEGRVDGSGMTRETIFSDSNRAGSWISEADVDFFTGGGPSEEASAASQEEQAEVRRRILIGAALTAATVAFALVPTEQLDGNASKASFYYLVPVLRSVSLLQDLAVEVEAGNLDSVPLVVTRVLNQPNNARRNMYSAIEYVPPSQQQAARELVGNFVDLVQQADYNKYYNTLGPRDGKQMAQFQDFSLKSIRAAAREGNAFLKLFPRQDVEAARDMINQY